MRKRRSPSEKKRLAYQRDHYVSGGESRHAFRKNWPKKKAKLNQKHRHRAAQTLHRLEKLGDFESIESSTIEVTAEELKKIDSREKLLKWGLQSLKEYVENNQENRKGRHGRHRRDRELITERCKALVTALEQSPASAKARVFLREVEASGSWGWDFSLFLRHNPDWRPRLEKAWLKAARAAEKDGMERQEKAAEKQRAKALIRAIQKRAKVR